jgi:hypothetical protein
MTSSRTYKSVDEEGSPLKTGEGDSPPTSAGDRSTTTATTTDAGETSGYFSPSDPHSYTNIVSTNSSFILSTRRSFPATHRSTDIDDLTTRLHSSSISDGDAYMYAPTENFSPSKVDLLVPSLKLGTSSDELSLGSRYGSAPEVASLDRRSQGRPRPLADIEEETAPEGHPDVWSKAIDPPHVLCDDEQEERILSLGRAQLRSSCGGWTDGFTVKRLGGSSRASSSGGIFPAPLDNLSIAEAEAEAELEASLDSLDVEIDTVDLQHDYGTTRISCRQLSRRGAPAV